MYGVFNGRTTSVPTAGYSKVCSVQPGAVSGV